MKKKKRPQLDLHGYTKTEVIDAVDQFLLKHSHFSRVEIMTGKGKGIVQKAVIDYLKKAHYPWTYKKENGKINQGVLVIFLD